VLIGVHDERGTKLANGRKTAGRLGGAARLIQRRQEHRDEKRDDSDDHQQFNECESVPPKR